MLPVYIKQFIRQRDELYRGKDKKDFILPIFAPKTHYVELANSGYFRALVSLRHCISIITDYYFGIVQQATKLDLFMLTTSISSPMGPGANSEAIPIKFGDLDSYLTDSSQFGFEPLLINGFDKVYCYQPSMRGENFDKRHLNQFFHCEAEIRGCLDDLFPITEEYVRLLCEVFLLMPNIVELISADPDATIRACVEVSSSKNNFKRITFDEAAGLLSKQDKANLIGHNNSGRDITPEGEAEIFNILKFDLPLWVTNFDRDRVAFYQKPLTPDSDKVINADLLLPSLTQGSFGGEVAGAGQRQDDPVEMYDTLRRQGISAVPYEWYINIRRLSGYNTTSGFGLGIERFLAWALCREDVKDVIIYPRLKNLHSCP